MNYNQLKPFLDAVFKLAIERCGAEFEKTITEQRQSREKFLKNVWVPLDPEDSNTSELALREIDFDTIVNISQEHLDENGYTKFLIDLGDLGLRFGQLDKAREVLKRILSDHTASISVASKGSVHQMLGDVALHQSDLDAAAKYFKTAKEIHLEDGDELRYAGALNAEGVIFAEQGKTQASYICFKDAHRMAQDLSNQALEIQTGMNLANLSHTLGNYQESLVHLHATQALIPDTDIEMQAKVNHNLGITHKALNHTDKSITCFDLAISLAEQSNDYYLRTLSFLEKSEVLSAIGEVTEGSALITTAFQAFSEYGDRLGMADAYKVFAKISSKRNADGLAKAFFNNSLRISEGMSNKLGSAETYIAMGDYFTSKKDSKSAMESYESAKQNLESMEAHARVADINKLLKKLK